MGFTKYESLRDRVVLVTGGASGIGEEFVRALADNGAQVAFFDLSQEAGEALTTALAGSARHAPLFLRCDVTRTDDLKAAIADDWPAMDGGTPHASGAAKQALDAIYRMLSVINDQRNRAIVAEIFSQLDRITEARRSRLIAAEGTVPVVIWLVLLEIIENPLAVVPVRSDAALV